MRPHGSLRGVKALTDFLRDAVSESELERIVRRAAGDLRDEMIVHVPEDTGELAEDIISRPKEVSEDRVIYEVGVPSESPSIDKAWATETGTWNYDVGTPANPKRSWPSKTKGSAKMPWLRFSVLKAGPRLRRQMAMEYAQSLDDAKKEASRQQSGARRRARRRAARARGWRRVARFVFRRR